MESRLLPCQARILSSPRKRWVRVPGSVDIRPRRKTGYQGSPLSLAIQERKRKLPEKSRIAGNCGTKVPWIPQITAKSELLGWVIPGGAHSELVLP